MRGTFPMPVTGFEDPSLRLFYLDEYTIDIPRKVAQA